jgi:hypothetical protein
MNIQSIYRLLIPYFRSRRRRIFHGIMQPALSRILDVGGYPGFWSSMGCQGHITCLNLDAHPAPSLPSGFTYVQGDARHLPYSDGEFDIVFSNSVIEHLGTIEDQSRFAAEIRRVGRGYWVQTPNRWFPVEPHLVAPFVHYWPKSVQKRLLRWFTIWGLVARPSREQVSAFLSEVRLLSEEEMRRLFPDATIHAERFLGLKKSFIAYKTVRYS